MTAFRAAFADMKLVKTRGVTQLIFEIPIEEFDAAYEVLGGMPVPAKERWFGIAAIQEPHQRKEADPKSTIRTPVKPQPELDTAPAGVKREKMNWRDVQPAAQAGIRCAEPTFRVFLREAKGQPNADETEAADAVRFICGVNSRVQLGTEHAARVIWHQLDTEYQAWLAKERVGA